MPTKVEIPAIGESITEAVIVQWLKDDGDQVAADEPICELETDKANFDLPAPAAGVLRRLKDVGETVQVGETIAHIDESAAAEKLKAGPRRQPAALAPRKAEKPAARTAPAEPRDRTAAPPEADAPTAPSTLVEARDPVEKPEAPSRPPAPEAVPDEANLGPEEEQAGNPALAGVASNDAPPSDEATPAEKPPAPARPPEANEAKSTAGPLTFDAQGIRRVPMSKIRRRIAERLVRAQNQAAMLTTFNEIDMSAVLDLRTRYTSRFAELHGVSLGLMSFFARACVLALQEFPPLNAEIDGDDIVYHEHIHLGVAVSTERGLVVPVLRDVEVMSFARVESEIKRMAAAARDGKLSLQELSGGTFTITNGGVYGSLFSTPILNPPQSGILGMHTIQKRPAVVNDRIEIRPLMFVALTYDHRLVDGKDSVSFLVRIKELLEDPARMILEI